FTRYLRTLLENPRYSRIALGFPGILLLILGILAAFGLVHYYLMAFVIVLGLFMFVKGFGVDRLAKNFYKWFKEYSPPPLRVQISIYSALAGFLCLAVGLYLGWNAAASVNINWDNWLMVLPKAAGFFVDASKDLAIVGVCVALSGRAIRWYFERDARLLRNIALIVLIGWSDQILDATAKILINPDIGYGVLIFTIVIGILIGLASLLTIIVVQRSAKGFFREAEEKVEEFEED
ncbi:MAG: DUF373 family protein, partial [Candidatus Bathyarchaeia archaeon]